MKAEARRILTIVPMMVVAGLALTGCMKFQGDLNINPDATASGTFTLEIAQQAAGLLGLTSAEALAGQVNEGKFGGGASAADVTCKPVERAGALAVECAFSNVSFAKADELWSISRQGDQLVLVVNNKQDSSTDMSGNPFASAIPKDSLDITFRFPGEIVSIEGANATKVDNQTVNVKGSIIDAFKVTVTAQAGGGGIPVWPVIVGVVVVALVIIVVIVLMSSRRKSAGSVTDGAYTPIVEDAAAAQDADQGSAAEPDDHTR